MNFQNPYARAEYKAFLQNELLTDDFKISEEPLSLEFNPKFIKNAVLIGGDKSLELKVIEVLHDSENDPRVGLSKDIFRLMTLYGYRRSIVLLHSSKSKNYRLSLAKIELSLDENKIKKEYSNPHRYSFFLGPDAKTHTPNDFLIKKGKIKDFEDLESRFSIEVVNKGFYSQIAILFTKLVGGKRTIGKAKYDIKEGSLRLPSSKDELARKEFAVRLIGRLVFCWFLKKKHSDRGIPLLSDEIVSLASVEKNKGYYHSILEPLFFQVLNTPSMARMPEFREHPWNIVPFLNGGLFEPHEGSLGDYYESGALGISKNINTLKVPDEWIGELFSIFETYNFTIDENTAVDVELSIDPEMLGRIFENLLAEINPDTGKSARKATGSYYTPRPIVEYMVNESIKQYLLNKTKLDNSQIDSLLSYENFDVTLNELEIDTVIDALDCIKVIDPACGSGAFPMGILQKMLLLLQKIDTDSHKWLDKKLSKIENNLLKKELEQKLKVENVNYIHKLGIIQNSIYGIDIQQIAVEISKLRFFLSLIVDEKVNDDKSNRGIRPLPNLEFKFVCANSLIELPKVKSQTTMFEATEEIEKLKILREDYFTSYGEDKKRIENEFIETQTRMFKHALNWKRTDTQTMKLSQWNPFSNEPALWFDSEWMFGIKDGFDIVIANPPYVGHKGGQKNLFKDIKKTSLGIRFNNERMDLFYYFFHLSIDLIRANGIVAFITTNYFVTADSAIKLRRDFRDRASISVFVNFNEFKIFESALGQHNMVTILKKANEHNRLCNIMIVNRKGFALPDILGQILQGSDSETFYRTILQDQLYEGSQLYISSVNAGAQAIQTEKVLEKLRMQQTLLGHVCSVGQGIVTGLDRISQKHLKKLPNAHLVHGQGCYVLNDSEFKQLSGETNEIIKPWFKNSDIQRYVTNCSNSDWLIYATVDHDIKSHKDVYKHLLFLKKAIQLRNYESGELSKASKLGKWWALSSARKDFNFASPKIVAPQRSLQNRFGYNEVPWYASADVYYITQKDPSIDLKYVLAILNSKLCFTWLYFKGKRKGEMLELYQKPLSEIPVKKIEHSKQKPIIELVNKILTITKDDDYLRNQAKQAKVKELEREIDQMVYKLYGLSDEEIKIIEGNSSDK